MTSQTLKISEIKEKSLGDILQTVLANQLVLTVQLPGGEEVLIQPKPRLKTLPVFEGKVPAGWKDAIY